MRDHLCVAALLCALALVVPHVGAAGEWQGANGDASAATADTSGATQGSAPATADSTGAGGVSALAATAR